MINHYYNNDLSNIIKINIQSLEAKTIQDDGLINWTVKCEIIDGYKPIGIIGYNWSSNYSYETINVYALQLIYDNLSLHCKNTSGKTIIKQPNVYILYIKSNLL